jgi:adenylate cyclase
MSREIERKFLVLNDRWRRFVTRSVRYRQGYLNHEKHCSIRVRTSDDRAWLNIKSVTIGAERQEFEYEIPIQEAHEILNTLSRKPLIEKTRYFVETGNHIWEVDVFEGENSGLVVAEIELEDPEERFEKPVWVGEEVTDDPRYYNTNLTANPYRCWQF